MYDIYDSKKEYLQHSKAIHSIADQYHIQEEAIRVVYEEILLDLQETARFKTFLSVLVTRHVKEILHGSGSLSHH